MSKEKLKSNGGKKHNEFLLSEMSGNPARGL